MDSLVQASQGAFTRVYQEAAAAEGGEPTAGASAEDEDIVEAEIVDEGDEEGDES